MLQFLSCLIVFSYLSLTLLNWRPVDPHLAASQPMILEASCPWRPVVSHSILPGHFVMLYGQSKGTERALYQYNPCSVLPGGLGSPGGHSFILLPIKSVGSQDTWLIKCWGVSGSWSSTPPVFLGHSGS